MVLDTTKPLIAPKDPSKGRETPHHLVIVLAILPMPNKKDLKGKGPAFTIAEAAKPTKGIGKENPPLKIN